MLMINEQWLPVVGYENLYAVSNHGRVMRLEGAFYCRPTSQVLKPRPVHDGYLRVYLCLGNGEKQWHRIHRLVARAFIGPCPYGFEVDHIDRNRDNNAVWNLAYVLSNDNKAKKLSNRDVAEIRRLHIEGFRQSDLARRFGVRPNHISRIVNFIRR